MPALVVWLKLKLGAPEVSDAAPVLLLTMVGTASAGSVAATRNTPTMEKRRVRRKGEAPQPRMIVTYFPPSEGSVSGDDKNPRAQAPSRQVF